MSARRLVGAALAAGAGKLLDYSTDPAYIIPCP